MAPDRKTADERQSARERWSAAKIASLAELPWICRTGTKPGISRALPTYILGEFLRDVMHDNMAISGSLDRMKPLPTVLKPFTLLRKRPG